ncbi:hypothetical protein GP486_001832 [Trichoglossum hirsutum]|uniref:PNPLA domain-containing protein n=1 Tax=Trichoglossum hirsutum TaxID=265104 RepID=A0A9P8LFD8_9PEZI|nr:hypothetical protein GP486_001832 [Trichoglossum hirsutum]
MSSQQPRRFLDAGENTKNLMYQHGSPTAGLVRESISKGVKRILFECYFPENEPGLGPEQPADLLLKNGDYPTGRVQYTILVTRWPRFGSAKLESAIRKVVALSGASETDLLSDGTERGCRTPSSVSEATAYPTSENIRAVICQTALATSAATTFFDPVSIGDRSLADGGLGANGP